jgi:hypothetical protein
MLKRLLLALRELLGVFLFMRHLKNLYNFITAELRLILGEPAEITAEEDSLRRFFRTLGK